MGILVVGDMQRPINTILVIRLSSIGDIVLTTPLLSYLCTAYPQARLDYCTKPSFVSLLASNPRISSLYTTQNPPAGRYDLVVDLQNNSHSQAIVRSLKSECSVKYHKANWKKFLLVYFKLNVYTSYHSVVERYLDSLKKQEAFADLDGCELFLTADDKAFASTYVDDSHIKTLGVCCGAKHFTKRYPPHLFAALLSHLLDHMDVRVLLLGGEEDSFQALEIIQALPDRCRPNVMNLSGTCTLMQSAALLERCDAVLCNDTGLMHIASAFGKKLFVLFGSSSPLFGFLPYHSPYDLFEVEGLHCKPCSHIGRDHCPRSHFRCMNNLLPIPIAERIIRYFDQ